MRIVILLAGAVLLASCGAEAPSAENPRATGAVTALRAPLESAPGLEIIVQDVYFAANAELPLHYHPGEEYIYLVEGAVTHIEEGREDRLYTAGEALRIGVGKVHSARTGDAPARAVIFRVHREGAPERVLVE